MCGIGTVVFAQFVTFLFFSFICCVLSFFDFFIFFESVTLYVKFMLN